MTSNFNFNFNFIAGMRLQALFTEGDASDPAVAAEIAQLSELMRPHVTKSLKLAHEALARAGTSPRKALEAVGLTREEVKHLADACLAIYEDKPETQA